MSSPNLILLLRRVGLVSAVLIATSGFAIAQTAAPSDQSDSTGSSSSDDPRLPQIAELEMPNGLASLPPAPTPSAQYDQRYGGAQHSIVNSLAFEAGGGFNAPVDTHHITWGWNINVGGGINFNKQ